MIETALDEVALLACFCITFWVKAKIDGFVCLCLTISFAFHKYLLTNIRFQLDVTCIALGDQLPV